MADGGDERNVKAPTEGGVANKELESPSLEGLPEPFPIFLSALARIRSVAEPESPSSAAWISSSSLGVGLGTRNELVLVDDAGVADEWPSCNGSWEVYDV